MTAWPDDTNNPLSELLALMGKLPSSDWPAQLEQFFAGQSSTVLKKLLMDDELSEALPSEVLQAVIRQLAMIDAPWAGDYVEAMPHGSLRAELLATLMAQWSADDLPAAIKWAQQLKDSSLQQPALAHLSYRWIETDPKGALAFVANHPGEDHQLLAVFVGLWSRDQPEAAAAWAVEHSTKSGMASVAASAVATWAAIDDLAAAEFVLRLPPGNLRNEAAISVMSALAKKDPATGALWTNAFPAGAGKNYAIENLAYSWASQDPGAALAWANRLSSAERDVAMFSGAGGLIEDRPALAATWTMSIQNLSLRIMQTERTARRWLETDRLTAEAWVLRSILPPETKSQLLASSPSGG
jgi:hypothetical protein